MSVYDDKQADGETEPKPFAWIASLAIAALVAALAALVWNFGLQNKIRDEQSKLAAADQKNAAISRRVEETNKHLDAQSKALGPSVGLTQHQLEDKSDQFISVQKAAQAKAALLAREPAASEKRGSVQTDVATVKTDVAGVKIDVASIQAELAMTQTKLAMTQAELEQVQTKTSIAQVSGDNPQVHASGTQTHGVDLPVYNAIFRPTADGQPASLIDRKKTLLRFFIGPNSPNNAIGKALVAIASPLTEATIDVPLTITMECGFCTGRRTDLVKVVYHGRTQLSSEAQFHIVPNLAIAQSLGAAVIVIDIRNSDTAVRYNRLVLNMSVQGAQSTQDKAGTTGLEEGTFTPLVVDNRSFRPDVIMTLRPEYGKPFDIGFEAINPELRKQLSGVNLVAKNIDGVRQVQFFHTYDLSSNELQSKQEETLTTLKGLMDQQNADLQRALAAAPSGAVVLNTNDFVKLSASDREKAFSTFAQLGDYLYTRLFLNSGATLKKLIGTLETFTPADNHPLKILIKTSGQAFPWQLLHVVGEKEDGSFWGLQFEVAVEDMSRPSPAVVLKKPASLDSGVSLFGTYVGADYSVQSLGNQQVKYFSQAFPTKQLIPANSSVIFRDNLKKRSSDLDFILVYTHGSDGWVSQQFNGQYVRLQLDPPGQRLIFSQDGSFVRPTDITALANGFDTSTGPFLRRNPVVLLNACETGMLFADEFTLPVAFLHLGARAVIATEAPVSNQFALLFGDALIDQMAQGKDMAAGVLNVRQKFVKQGNPLGLVYAYYMNDGIAEAK